MVPALRYAVEHYTPVALEVLRLADEIAAAMRDRSRRGMADADDPARMNELERITELAHNGAARNAERAQEEAEAAAEDLEERRTVQCPQCKERRRMDIVGEAVHREAGVTNDQLRCTACGHAFTAPLPRTYSDKIKWLDFLFTTLTQVRPDGTTLAERGDKAYAVALQKKVKESKAQFAALRQADRKQALDEEKVDHALLVVRDLLLSWRIGLSGLTGRGGVA